MDTQSLVSILQASIAPFVLISGIGLLLLSMTNRIARPTDLIRQILTEMDTAPAAHRHLLFQQVALLRKRCYILRASIALAILAIFCVSGVTLLLYAIQLFNLQLTHVVEIVFGLSLISLIASLLFLLEDFRITLISLDIEIGRKTEAK